MAGAFAEDLADLLDKVDEEKIAGNKLFTKGDTAGAERLYLRAFHMIFHHPLCLAELTQTRPLNVGQDLLFRLKELAVTLKCNLASCHLHSKEYDLATEDCRTAMLLLLCRACSPWAREERDFYYMYPTGQAMFHKALKRRMLAFEALGNFAAAGADLRLLSHLAGWQTPILPEKEAQEKLAMHGFAVGELCSTDPYRPQGRPPYGRAGGRAGGTGCCIGATTTAQKYSSDLWRWGQSAVEYNGRHYLFGGSPVYDWEKLRGRPDAFPADSMHLTIHMAASGGADRWLEMRHRLTKDTRPPPYMHHTAVVYRDCMYVWGGIRLDLPGKLSPPDSQVRKRHKKEARCLWEMKLGDDCTWRKITLPGTCPSPRAHHSAVVDERRGKMYVFGGWAFLESEADRKKWALGDLWEFDLRSHAWKLLWQHDPQKEELYITVPLSELGPLPRWGHASWISQGGLFIYGGGRPLKPAKDPEAAAMAVDRAVGAWNVGHHGLATGTLGDLWRYDLEAGTWEECYQSRNWPGTRMLMGVTKYEQAPGLDVVVIAGGVTSDAHMSLPKKAPGGPGIRLAALGYLADVHALCIVSGAPDLWSQHRLDWYQVNPADEQTLWITARYGCTLAASRDASGKPWLSIIGGYLGPHLEEDTPMSCIVDVCLDMESTDPGVPAASGIELESRARTRYMYAGCPNFPSNDVDLSAWPPRTPQDHPPAVSGTQPPPMAASGPSRAAPASRATPRFEPVEVRSSGQRGPGSGLAGPGSAVWESGGSGPGQVVPSEEDLDAFLKSHMILRRGEEALLLLLSPGDGPMLEPLPCCTELAECGDGRDVVGASSQVIAAWCKEHPRGVRSLNLAPHDPAEKLGCSWWGATTLEVWGMQTKLRTTSFEGGLPWTLYQAVKLFGTAKAADQYYARTLAAHGGDSELQSEDRVGPEELGCALDEYLDSAAFEDLHCMLDLCRNAAWWLDPEHLLVIFTHGRAWCKLLWLIDDTEDPDEIFASTFPIVYNAFKRLGDGAEELPVECAGCGAKGPAEDMKRCAGCRLLRYCSPDCQTAHWPTHKPVCTAQGVEEVPWQ